MNLYLQLVKMVWKMYNQCHLVHADLSEYNLLYHKKKLYIIDVSQSVEHDHPHSSEFLRKDCTNVIEYFRKRVLHPIMTVREMFEFVVKDSKTLRESMNPEEVKDIENEDDLVDLYLVNFHESIRDRPDNYNEIHKVDEEVFKKSYIPRNLDEVIDIQRDVDMVESGKLNDLIYSNIVGIATPKNTVNETEEKEDKDKENEEKSESINSNDNDESNDDNNDENENGEENGEENSDENDDENDEEEESEDDEKPIKTSKLKKYEDKEAKKERKKQMKEEKREKRKNKIPKSVKKRKQKISTEKGKSKGKKKL